MKAYIRTAALAVLLATAASSRAYYKQIVVDGSFGDWADVPIAATDTFGDHDTGPDLAMLQIANDETNVYLHITYHAAINPNAGPSVFLAVDSDQNTGTGFDVFSLGLIGSEAGWQNDFPFQQSAGNFNSGTISAGGAAIAPYNTETIEQEYAIPRTAIIDDGSTPVFGGEGFSLLVYTDPTGANETMGPASYTFSTHVEPAEFSQITLTNVRAFLVTNSLPAVTYRLESNESLPSTNWVYTGYQASGNGTNLYLYDSTGFSTGKSYRIISLY